MKEEGIANKCLQGYTFMMKDKYYLFCMDFDSNATKFSTESRVIFSYIVFKMVCQWYHMHVFSLFNFIHERNVSSLIASPM